MFSTRLLEESFGVTDAHDHCKRLPWIRLQGGETLMRQSKPGDAMYFIVSGRPRALVDEGEGMLRAVRDSYLARLDRSDFMYLLDRGASNSLPSTRHAIRRLQTERRTDLPMELPVAMGRVCITPGIDLSAITNELAAHMGRHRTRVVDSRSASLVLQLPARDGWNEASLAHMSAWLDEVAATRDFTLLIANPEPTPWTHCIARQCDEVLLVANTARPPALHDIETSCLVGHQERAQAAQILILMHETWHHHATRQQGMVSGAPTHRPGASTARPRRGHRTPGAAADQRSTQPQAHEQLQPAAADLPVPRRPPARGAQARVSDVDESSRRRHRGSVDALLLHRLQPLTGP